MKTWAVRRRTCCARRVSLRAPSAPGGSDQIRFGFAVLILIFLVALLYVPVSARAAPEEIVIFDDEFKKPGELGYELHLNYVPSGRRTPDYDGEQPPHGIFRFMPE